MSFFESKEEKMAREKREKEKREKRLQQEHEEEERQREDRKKLREDKFMKELEEKTKKKIITLILSDYEGNDWKELTMNYLLEKGYVCVQNDISCTRSCAHYALTFVRKDYTSFFLNLKWEIEGYASTWAG